MPSVALCDETCAGNLDNNGTYKLFIFVCFSLAIITINCYIMLSINSTSLSVYINKLHQSFSFYCLSIVLVPKFLPKEN